MLPVLDQVPTAGSYSSALRIPFRSPPAIRTLPFESNVVVGFSPWFTIVDPVAVQDSVWGLYTSAENHGPTMRTLPSDRSVAVCDQCSSAIDPVNDQVSVTGS